MESPHDKVRDPKPGTHPALQLAKVRTRGETCPSPHREILGFLESYEVSDSSEPGVMSGARYKTLTAIICAAGYWGDAGKQVRSRWRQVARYCGITGHMALFLLDQVAPPGSDSHRFRPADDPAA